MSKKAKEAPTQSKSSNAVVQQAMSGGGMDAAAVELVGAPGGNAMRRQSKLQIPTNPQLAAAHMAGSPGQQITPLTPNHAGPSVPGEMRSAAAAAEARMLQQNSYSVKAKSQKDSSHRKIVQPRDGGRDSGSGHNQQQLSQSIQALQQKHKSIDEYKTQISNQIRSIKAGVKSGLEQQSLKQQQTWHVSFKPNSKTGAPQASRFGGPPPDASPGDAAFLIPTREVLENQLESRIQNEYGQQLIDQIHYATSEPPSQFKVSPAKTEKLRHDYAVANQALAALEAESGFLPSIDKRSHGDPSAHSLRMNRTGSKITAIETAMMAAQADGLGSRGHHRRTINQAHNYEIGQHAATESSASRRHPRSVKHTDKKSSKLRDDANQALVFAQAQKQHKRNSNADLGGAKHRTQQPEAKGKLDRDRMNMSQIKGKQEKQLEDLNETLQRLAREKYTKNTPGGAGGLQGARSRKNRHETGGAHSKTSGHHTSGLDPSTMLQMDPFSAQLAEINAQAQARREKKKRRANKSQDATSKKKQEEQQQQAASFVGDALVNQRLQGVKAVEQRRNDTGLRRDDNFQTEPSAQNRRNVLITPQEPIVLKNANIVMAQRQFVQTTTNLASNTQAHFAVRPLANLVVSDTEDNGNDGTPKLIPGLNAERSAPVSQRPPPKHQTKHYMTQTQPGFEVMAGGRIMHFSSPSKRHADGSDFTRDRHMTSHGQSEALSGDDGSRTPAQIPAPTQRSGNFSSVMEEEYEDQSPLLRNKADSKCMTVAASSPSGQASPEANIKSAYTSVEAQMSDLQNSKQNPNKQAELLEQMKQLYSSPNRPSGLQLIRCEQAEKSEEVQRQFAASSRQGEPSFMSQAPSPGEVTGRSGSAGSQATTPIPSAGQARGPPTSAAVTAFDDPDGSRFGRSLNDQGLRSATQANSTRQSGRVSRETTNEPSRMIVGEGNIQIQQMDGDRLAPPQIRQSLNVLASMDGLGGRASGAEDERASAVHSEQTGASGKRSQVRRAETDKLTPSRPIEEGSRQLSTIDAGRNMTIDSDGGSRRAPSKKRPHRKATLESPEKMRQTGRGSLNQTQQSSSQARQARQSPANEGASASTNRRDKRLMKSPSRHDASRPPLPKGSSPEKPVMPPQFKMSSRSPPGEHGGTSGSRRDKNSSIPPGHQGRKGASNFSVIEGSRAQSIERAPDDGYISSDAPPAAVELKLGHKIPRDWSSFCQEYVMMKGQYTKRMAKEAKSLFTKRRYFKNKVKPDANEMTIVKEEDHDSFTWSQRLYLSRECATSEDRRQLPVLIVNLDGAVGYWDEQRRFYYVLRHKVVEGLIQLSYDFRLIAVSSARKRLICKVVSALMCMPITDEQRTDTQLRHLVFDAVYQLRTQNQDSKWGSYIKNIDEVHFDISQILLDMQFKPHKKDSKHRAGGHARTFQTFWETELYRPHHKVLILTTDRHLFDSTCYSFDYNYLYQAFKFRHEEKKRAPVILQVPHLRLQPKQTFDPVLQLIFALQNVAMANNLKAQPGYRLIDGQKYMNPGYIPYEVVKKLLATRYRQMQAKMRKTAPAKGLRVFDCGEDPFVDLEGIDFSRAFGFLKKHYKGIPGLEAADGDRRKSDWLQIKKYYLKYQPGKEPVSPQKIKQNLKVTFEESPEIAMAEERDKASSSMRAAATTHDSSKSDRFSIAKTHFTNEDAKNAYNGLMIRNFKIQQEINNYARHQRIQNQLKHERRKREEKRLAQQEAEESPIVIYDGDEREPMPALKSSMKPSQKTLRDVPPGTPQIKEKSYAFKYQVLQVRCNEPIEEQGEYDFGRHHVINLGAAVQATPAVRSMADPKQRAAYRVHTSQAVTQEMARDKGRYSDNALIELLSKRQTKIQYTTNQEMHLKNNLSQLVDGEQQYKDQHQMLMDEEELKKQNGDKVLSAREGKTNVKRDDYIDNI